MRGPRFRQVGWVAARISRSHLRRRSGELSCTDRTEYGELCQNLSGCGMERVPLLSADDGKSEPGRHCLGRCPGRESGPRHLLPDSKWLVLHVVLGSFRLPSSLPRSSLPPP